MEDIKIEPEQTIKPLRPKHVLRNIGIILLPLLVGAGFYFYMQKDPIPETPPVSQQVGNQTVGPYDPRIKNREASGRLTKEEFDSEREYYINLVIQKDPGIALKTLRENVEKDVALLRSCHAMTHEIGRFSYTKYLDFSRAMQYLDEICNTGYMHGVIEELFYDSGDIIADMSTICGASSANDEGRCYHGVGHGVMFYTSNDLPESIRLCETYPKTSAEQYCAEGVFMENFNLDQKDHVSEYLSSDDLFYPCGTQLPRYKDVCYYYAPLHYFGLNKSDYDGGLDWCNTADPVYVLKCIRGVAAVMIKENISNPQFVESMCMTAEAKQIPYCIDGMIGLYINHHNSPQKGYELCETLLESNRRACTAGVKAREASFQGEVRGLYIMND
jgi:hypothetical protein